MPIFIANTIKNLNLNVSAPVIPRRLSPLPANFQNITTPPEFIDTTVIVDNRPMPRLPLPGQIQPNHIDHNHAMYANIQHIFSDKGDYQPYIENMYSFQTNVDADAKYGSPWEQVDDVGAFSHCHIPNTDPYFDLFHTDKHGKLIVLQERHNIPTIFQYMKETSPIPPPLLSPIGV